MKANRSFQAFREDRAGNTDALQNIAIGGVILIIAFVITLTVLPILTSSVKTAQDDANTTTAQDNLLGLITTIFVAGIALSGVGFLFRGIRGIRAGK